MLRLVLICLTLSAVSGCGNTPPSTKPTERLKEPAAAHAEALAGDDMDLARETGVRLLSLLGAALGW